MPFGIEGFCAMVIGLFQFKSLARLGDDDVFPAFFPQDALVELHGVGIAVDEEGFLDLAWVLAFQVIHELVVVAMAAEGINGENVGLHLVFVAEDGNGLGTRIGQQTGTQGLRRTIADGQDGVLRVGDAVGDMML